MFAASVHARALPLYHLAKVDYLDSQPITNSNLYPNSYPPVEVPWGVPAVAWRMLLTPHKIRVSVHNPTAIGHFATLNTSDFKYVTAQGTIPLQGVQDVSIIYVPPSGTSQEVEITISGLPTFIAKGDLSFDLNCTSAHAVLGLDDLGIRLFIILTTPKTVGLQNPAWIEVLELACDWAFGVDTDELAAKRIANGIFGHAMFYRARSEPTYVIEDSNNDPPLAWFMLRKFLDDLNTAGLTSGECRDFSHLVQITLAAIGVATEAQRLTPVIPPGWPGNFEFRTNKVCPSGAEVENDDSYVNYWFLMHQVAYGAAVGVVDASLGQMYDPSAGSYRSPPVGWNIQNFWQTDISPIILNESMFLGLAHDSVANISAYGAAVPMNSPQLIPLLGLL